MSEGLDSAIYAIAPVAGAQRRAARRVDAMRSKRATALGAQLDKLAGGWDTETDKRVRGHRWSTTSGYSTDALLELDLETLQQHASELYRTNDIAHSAIEGRVANEIGIGIQPVPQVEAFDEDKNVLINDAIRKTISRWSKYGVDRKKIHTLRAVQSLVGRSFASHGEAFVIFGLRPPRSNQPIGLVLDVIAPERVTTPPQFAYDPLVRMGVKYNTAGEVLGYYVRTVHPGDDKSHEYKWDFFPRDNDDGTARMRHVFDPLFPEQSRGLPWLIASMNRIKDCSDFFEAELIAKQIEACFALIFEDGDEDEDVSMLDKQLAETAETTSSGKRLQDIEPGLVHYSKKGEKVQVVDPSRPGSTFAPFIESALRSIAASLNYPYELLAKNFFRTTFASGRLALLDGRLGFRLRRQVLIDMFLVPLYEAVVHESVFVDEMGGAIDLLEFAANQHVFFEHKWQGQGWSFIDLDKETKAHERGVKAGFETLEDVAAEQGKTYTQVEAQRFTERTKEVERQVELRKLQWDLEAKAGIPHMDEQDTDDESEDESEDNESDDDLALDEQGVLA